MTGRLMREVEIMPAVAVAFITDETDAPLTVVLDVVGNA
jgi:hypothetical protein